jgi:DNA replication protein DnaC
MEISNRTELRVCTTHGEYEAMLYTIGDRVMGGQCQACAKHKEQQAQERQRVVQSDQERRRIEGLFQRAGIPLRFQSRTFDSYQANNEGQAKALRKARSYADNWRENVAAGTSLIFSGNAGTGKTHLACAIANELMGQGVSSVFTTVSDAMRAIKRTYDAGSQMTEVQAIQAFVDPGLLILDEVGANRGTEYEVQLVFDIINKRYENCRPTIILTNLDPQALRECLGERVVDRLREGGGKLVAFTWDSFRA